MASLPLQHLHLIWILLPLKLLFLLELNLLLIVAWLLAVSLQNTMINTIRSICYSTSVWHAGRKPKAWSYSLSEVLVVQVIVCRDFVYRNSIWCMVWMMIIISLWKTEGATQLCVISEKKMWACEKPKGHACFVLIHYRLCNYWIVMFGKGLCFWIVMFQRRQPLYVRLKFNLPSCWKEKIDRKSVV